MSEPLLKVTGLTKSFGGVAAVNNVSLDLMPGKIIGLIGPNGAGKTTFVNLVTGVHRASAGSIWFDGADVNGQKPFEAARRGLSRTFQIVQPFPQMTVIENVTAGALFAGGNASRAGSRDEAMEHLRFVGLEQQAEQPAQSLTLPSRKRLELAKSLAMKPKLLLLDEVNAGLNSTEILGAIELIREIAARGITVLIIEHLMKVVFSLCDELVVLHHGELIARGEPQAVAGDPQVIEAYLGSRYAQKPATA